MQDNNATSRALTFGEKAAGITFNPGNNPEVDHIKRMVADFIDLCNDARANATDPEKSNYYSKAINEMEKAQMLAVKAATWSH